MEKRSFSWICRHCKFNPTALPPYVKMKRFFVNGLTKTKLYKHARKNKLRVNCVFCQAVRERGSRRRLSLILNDKRFS